MCVIKRIPGEELGGVRFLRGSEQLVPQRPESCYEARVLVNYIRVNDELMPYLLQGRSRWFGTLAIHPGLLFLLQRPLRKQEYRLDHQGELRVVDLCVLQHPMSRNIASGRSFNSSKTREYAGILATLSIANLNPRMQGYGKS